MRSRSTFARIDAAAIEADKRIAVNDGTLGQVAIEAHRVHQKMIGLRIEKRNCVLHRHARRLVNIDLINPSGVHGSDGPDDCMFANALGKNFAAFCGQKLRVAQAANAIAGIEHDGCGDHRAEQRSAADFVHARHQLRARSPRQLFVFQRAAQTL